MSIEGKSVLPNTLPCRRPTLPTDQKNQYLQRRGGEIPLTTPYQGILTENERGGYPANLHEHGVCSGNLFETGTVNYK